MVNAELRSALYIYGPGYVLSLAQISNHSLEIKKGIREKMAEEGQVISCHTVEAWNNHLQRENESKKLVCLTTIYSFFFFFFFWYVIFFSYSDCFSSSRFWVFKALGVIIT